MMEHLRPHQYPMRKDAWLRRKGLPSKNLIHLICVMIMQLLQLTQGLVTASDLANYNAVKKSDNTSMVIGISPSSRTFFPEGASSILYEMVSPSAVMITADRLKVEDSLILSRHACASYISCDIAGSGSKSCCQHPSETENKNFDELPKHTKNLSVRTELMDITATQVKKPTQLDSNTFNSNAVNLSVVKERKRKPNSNLILTTDDKCQGREIFSSPNANKRHFSLRIKRDAQRTPITARNRFRRPTTVKTTTEQEEEEPEEVTQPAFQRRKPKNLHSASNRPTVASRKGLIKPSRVSSAPSSRAKFTLREESTTQKTSSTSARRASFRRPQISSGIGNKRVTSPKINSSIGGNRRINTHEESHTRSSLPGRSRPASPTGRSRSGNLRDSESRSRHRGSQDNDPVIDLNDGTITVTHLNPSETQIPVVNGQLTEYKQIVVAKTSTEVLGPHQYTKTFAANGQTVLILTSQVTSVNHAGATEVTQFVLHESPTTSVTFTPTTIRGRRTSFSYVLPSTAYSVENVVSTIQPQISADAPLANILLSQLLLGNVGFPNNALFGAADNNGNLGNGNINPAAQTPVTEYKTRASTYVTTVIQGTSTVLPITFQGKKIITTIYDTTPQVITATEFVTDTIVLPGAAAMQQQQQPQNQINNLLLQQLLLQQVAQKSDPMPQVPQITPTTQQAFSFENTKLPDFENENHLRDTGHNGLSPSGNSFARDDATEQTTERGKTRRNGKKHKKRNKEEAKSGETSVVTLYISGKFPGEFSTVLSTVYVKADATVHKRQATDYYQPGDVDMAEGSDNDFGLPGGFGSESVSDSTTEATQSLTEILGDNHKWQVDDKPMNFN